jgi:hypothetical protein
VDKGSFDQKDKHWGKSLSPSEFCQGLEEFFNNGRSVSFQRSELVEISKVMEIVTRLRYACALLCAQASASSPGAALSQAAATDQGTLLALYLASMRVQNSLLILPICPFSPSDALSLLIQVHAGKPKGSLSFSAASVQCFPRSFLSSLSLHAALAFARP